MDKTLIASAKTTVNASAENVWKVLTTPESIKLFLFGTDVTTDWKTESHIKFVGEYNGQTYEDKGIVIINEPFSLLEYSYWSSFSGLADKPENYSMVIWRSVWFMTKLKTQVYLTTAMFFLLAVFREDFNSGHKSSIGTLSVISHWLGFRPDAYYKEISDFGFLVNLIWVIFFVGQILCLVKLKKLKSKKIN